MDAGGPMGADSAATIIVGLRRAWADLACDERAHALTPSEYNAWATISDSSTGPSREVLEYFPTWSRALAAAGLVQPAQPLFSSPTAGLSVARHLELLAQALAADPDLNRRGFVRWLAASGNPPELAATLFLHFRDWQEALLAAKAALALQSSARSAAICRSRAAIAGTSHQSSRREPRSAF